MLTGCSSSFILYPLLYVLFAQTAIVPATISLVNQTISELLTANESGTLSAVGVAPAHLYERNIVLAFLVKGVAIPEDEVEDTLIEAEHAIAELVRAYPTQRITNDRFEYRRPNGNMLISIKANEDESIAWMELSRILQGLFKYMTGTGVEKTHYQELEFEIDAGGQEKPDIGFGLVWFFKSVRGDIQNETTLPLLISSTDEENLQLFNRAFPIPSNDSLTRTPNTTLVLPGIIDVQEAMVFHIPKTSLILSFYAFGPPIPPQSVKDTLQGAMANVRPFLNGPSATKRIADDAFRWILPLSHQGIVPVAVTVFTYPGQKVSWRQLFDVLFGLYAFTTTFGTELQETHYQILGYRILDSDSLKSLGVGTISYFRSGVDQLAKRERVEVPKKGDFMRRPITHNVSLLSPIVYPVTGTDITLTFTFLGRTPIPPGEVRDALTHARQAISQAVASMPDTVIPDIFRDISASRRVSTNIIEYAEKFITWKEIDQILTGILDFCQDDRAHDRQLVFEIDNADMRRGRIGFGTLLYLHSDPITVDKRALAAVDTGLQLPDSTTVSQHTLTALASPVSYRIPGSPFTLSFNTLGLGGPIPSIYVNAAFTTALRNIQTHILHHPADSIPDGRWWHGGIVTKVWITVVPFTGTISWQDLTSILEAVLRFMTEDEEHRCRDTVFLINEVGKGRKGYGNVLYLDKDASSVDKDH